MQETKEKRNALVSDKKMCVCEMLLRKKEIKVCGKSEKYLLKVEVTSNDLIISANTISISKYSHALSLNSLSNILILIEIKLLSITPGTR